MNTEHSNDLMHQFVYDADIPRASLRFDIIKPVISESMLLPQIDIPRMEACSCFVIGAYTALVTLTNHLLERYCKELLLVYDHGNEFMRMYKREENIPIESSSYYLKKDLSSVLKSCKSKGLLSKEQWKVFDIYREVFRNGYSHYDPSKILQGATYTVTELNVNGVLSEPKEIKFEDSPHVGLAIDDFARKNGWNYFVSVENFMRDTVKYFHNPNHDPKLPKVEYLE